MPTFDFTLVVDSLDASDPEQIDNLFAGGCEDAVPTAQDGVAMVAFARDADRPENALWSAVRDIETAVSGARVARLDADLVNLTEIAHRAGVKRQAARLWAKGERRQGSRARRRGSETCGSGAGPMCMSGCGRSAYRSTRTWFPSTATPPAASMRPF